MLNTTTAPAVTIATKAATVSPVPHGVGFVGHRRQSNPLVERQRGGRRHIQRVGAA